MKRMTPAEFEQYMRDHLEQILYKGFALDTNDGAMKMRTMKHYDALLSSRIEVIFGELFSEPLKPTPTAAPAKPAATVAAAPQRSNGYATGTNGTRN